jgi:hypothetical protein
MHKLIIDYITTLIIMFLLIQVIKNDNDINIISCLFYSLIFSFFAILIQEI